MIEGWLRQLQLTARSKGLAPSLACWAAAITITSIATLIFLSMTAFIWLSQQYDELTAAVTLTCVYFFLAIVSVALLLLSRRRMIERARRELAKRSPSLWQDPRVLAAGVEVARIVGWKRTLPLAAIGLFAAGIAREWSNHNAEQDKP